MDEQHRPAEAAAVWRRAARLGGRFRETARVDEDDRRVRWSSWVRAGMALGSRSRSREEVGCYLRAIFVDPRLADAYSNLGTELGNLGRRDEALGAFGRALALDPGHANAHNNRGVVLGRADFTHDFLM
jgi:tetratricopeptide (TPR) repeat protein